MIEQLSPEFWTGTGIASIAVSFMAFMLKRYIKKSDERHDSCDEKIDKIIDQLGDIKVEIARISTIVDILVYSQVEKKNLDEHHTDTVTFS